jgi:hypothetical protein
MNENQNQNQNENSNEISKSVFQPNVNEMNCNSQYEQHQTEQQSTPQPKAEPETTAETPIPTETQTTLFNTNFQPKSSISTMKQLSKLFQSKSKSKSKSKSNFTVTSNQISTHIQHSNSTAITCQNIVKPIQQVPIIQSKQSVERKQLSSKNPTEQIQSIIEYVYNDHNWGTQGKHSRLSTEDIMKATAQNALTLFGEVTVN